MIKNTFRNLKKLNFKLNPKNLQNKNIFFFTYRPQLPYNFDGISPGLDAQKCQQLNYLMKELLGDEVLVGFAYAYSNLIQAISQKDFEYLHEILEPNLYNQMKSSLLELHTIYEFQNLENQNSQSENNNLDKDIEKIKQNVQIIKQIGDENVPQDSIVIGSFDMHQGVKFERHLNGNLQGSRQEMNMMNLAKLNFYGLNTGSYLGGGQLTKPILRVDAYYSTNLKLYITDSTGKLIEGENQLNQQQIHKIRFETNPGNETINKQNMFSTLLSMAKPGSKNMTKIFNELFLGDNFEWRISDIDDALNGNEFDA